MNELINKMIFKVTVIVVCRIVVCKFKNMNWSGYYYEKNY